MADALIIEDDPDSQTIMATLVGALSLKVDVTDNGTTALEWVQSPTARYRLIISDLALPGNFDGLELMRRFRADPRFTAIPTIAVTAFDFPHIRVQAMEAGFTHFFVKPISPTDFLVMLQTLFA